MMRTTLNLDTGLFREVKKKAASDHKTLTQIFEEALRSYLMPSFRAKKPFKLKLLTKRGILMPGVDLADRDSLYQKMEEA